MIVVAFDDDFTKVTGFDMVTPKGFLAMRSRTWALNINNKVLKERDY